MTRTGLTALIAIAITLILVACDRGGGVPLPELTLTGTDRLTIGPGTQMTVTGTGFFEPRDALRTTVQVCGVTIPADLVEPVMHQVALPPAGMRNVRTAEAITFEVAAGGFVAGTDQIMTVTRPDGASATLGGINCESPVAPEPQPDPDPEPQPDPDPEPQPEQ